MNPSRRRFSTKCSVAGLLVWSKLLTGCIGLSVISYFDFPPETDAELLSGGLVFGSYTTDFVRMGTDVRFNARCAALDQKEINVSAAAMVMPGPERRLFLFPFPFATCALSKVSIDAYHRTFAGSSFQPAGKEVLYVGRIAFTRVTMRTLHGNISDEVKEDHAQLVKSFPALRYHRVRKALEVLR